MNNERAPVSDQTFVSGIFVGRFGWLAGYIEAMMMFLFLIISELTSGEHAR